MNAKEFNALMELAMDKLEAKVGDLPDMDDDEVVSNPESQKQIVFAMESAAEAFNDIVDVLKKEWDIDPK